MPHEFTMNELKVIDYFSSEASEIIEWYNERNGLSNTNGSIT